MAKKPVTKKKQLPPGEYTGVKIKTVKIVKGQLQMSLDFTQARPVPKPPIHVTEPSAGHLKYLVLNDKLGIYTAIGADNIHHASNKATKLFGKHWSKLRTQFNSQDMGAAKFVHYKEFVELIKTLEN